MVSITCVMTLTTLRRAPPTRSRGTHVTCCYYLICRIRSTYGPHKPTGSMKVISYPRPPTASPRVRPADGRGRGSRAGSARYVKTVAHVPPDHITGPAGGEEGKVQQPEAAGYGPWQLMSSKIILQGQTHNRLSVTSLRRS